MAAEQALRELGGELLHHMPDDGSGVYIKQTFIPAGVKLAMHTHTFTHKSVLCRGLVRVTTPAGEQIIDAPAVLSIREGVPHEVEALTPAVWLCVHATDVLDVESIDHHLVREAAHG
jgi:quercetin dioxygenase-like cupin family protein